MLFSSDVDFAMSAAVFGWCSRVFGEAAVSLEPLHRHSADRIEPSFRRPLAPTGMSCNKS